MAADAYGGRHVLWLLGALAALVGLLAIAARPPSARGKDAPVDAFAAARAMADVRGLTAGDAPHAVGSPDHARARAFVEARVRELGLEPTVDVQPSCFDHPRRGRSCANVANVLARIPGTKRGGPALMLAAHYDSVPAGPGAGDDAAGVATILEISRVLRATGPHANDVILLIDDGEEAGLLGARAFVAHHPWAKDARVVLNFEARGNQGQTSMFETSEGSAWLVELYAHAAARPTASSLIYALYKKLPNDTDLTVFKQAGMLGLNFAFADRVADYHTPRDRFDRLDPRSVQHMGDQGLAAARALADADLAQPADAEAVWFDLFSIALVRYRARWVIPLALAAVAAFAAALRARRRELDVQTVARGVSAFAFAVFGAAIGAAALSVALNAARHSAGAPLDAPMPTWLAAVALAVAAASFAIPARMKRSEEPSASLGVALAWLCLALAAAFELPGGSYLPLVAFVASIAPLAIPEGGRGRFALSVGAVVVAGVLWLPVVRILLVMIGAQVLVATAVPVAMFVTIAAPILARVEGRARLAIPVVAGATCLVASIVAVVT